jgi:hypothetical protein
MFVDFPTQERLGGMVVCFPLAHSAPANDQGRHDMGETPNNQGLQQQPNDAQRPQVEQQNQQGDNRAPQQQPQNPQQTQPGQQNQQADRQRREGEGLEGGGEDQLNNGVSGGVDTGAIEPGRTGEGGAER